MFSYVKCRQCGRMLRAQRRPEPTVIRCWECQAEVKVPRHRMAEGPKPVDKIRGAMGSEWVELAAVVILLALAVTIAGTVPYAGPWLALAILVSSARLYLRRVEEASMPGYEPVPADGGRMARMRQRLGRLALAAAVVVGLVGPARLFDGSAQHSYRPPLVPPPLPLVVMILVWIAVPLAAFALVAQGEGGRLGPRRALAVAWKRRWSTLLALLLPVVAFAATEGAIVGVLVRVNRLRSVILDVSPPTKGLVIDNRGLVFENGAFIFLTPERAVQRYAQGLARGTALAASVPISFRRGLEPRINVQANGFFRPEEYLLTRLGISTVTLVVLIASLIVQAEWLGRIASSCPIPEDEDEDEDEEEGEGGAASFALPGVAPGEPLALPPSGPGATADGPARGLPS